MRIADLRHRLRSLGAKPKHEEHVLRLWANALPQTHGRRRIEDWLPLELREALVALKGPLGNVPAFRKVIQSVLEDDAAREKLLKELTGSKGNETP